MKKRNTASSAILSGILFVIFCMASTFATGRTFSPASLQGKFGLPPSALSYQLQDDLAIQSLNELKSYPFLTLVFSLHWSLKARMDKSMCMIPQITTILIQKQICHRMGTSPDGSIRWELIAELESSKMV